MKRTIPGVVAMMCVLTAFAQGRAAEPAASAATFAGRAETHSSRRKQHNGHVEVYQWVN
ncbi:MAG: hypothetical protein GXX96_05460 [Planctomycetaceae bacterium]|nr:hypothetical protein [Planctomycetaceae bacterium]